MRYVLWNNRLECRFKVNNLPDQAISINLPPGDLFVLSFGNFGKTAKVSSGAETMAVDNILLAEDTADIQHCTPFPRDFAIIPSDTNRFVFRVNPAPEDSLGLLEVSETPKFRPLLFSRRIELARPYRLDFPLKPGDYYLRAAALKKNGFISDYFPARKISITSTAKFQNEFAIRDAEIIDELTGKPVSELSPEHWYVLRLKLSTVQGCFALFYLHHGDYMLGGPQNKGGYFDRKGNYIFNFSLGDDKWFYASREGPQGGSLRIDGQRFLYIDDSDSLFKPDTQTNTAKIRFQLLKEALPGDWILSGYMERDTPEERSYLFHRPYKVLSEREAARKRIEEREKRNKIIALTLVISGVLLTGGVIFGTRWRQNRRRGPESSFLPILKAQGLYIRDANHRHRHIVQRAQSFIMGHLDKDISLSDIAGHLNLSGTWVGIVFKEATGYTVVQFINKVKIEKARELLLRGDLNATDVAMSVGYSSLTHFRRVFKEQTGKNPSDFRKVQ